MGTRSNIAYKKEDDSIVSSYCHYDGYVEHNGVMLLKHYNGEKPEEFKTEYLMMRDIDTLFIEFIYLFKDGEWNVSRSMSVSTPEGYRDTQFYHSSFKSLSEAVTIEMMQEEKAS